MGLMSTVWHIVDSTAARLLNGGIQFLRVSFAADIATVEGGSTASHSLVLKCNPFDDYPNFKLRHTGTADFNLRAVTDALNLNYGLTTSHKIMAAGGHFFRETTTPTAIPNFGCLYAKADNHLYFQDGAGTEHMVV